METFECAYVNKHGVPHEFNSSTSIPITTNLPLECVERKGCADGIIDTLEKYEVVFFNGKIYIGN